MSSDPTAQPDASDVPNVTSLHGKSVDAGAQAQPVNDPRQNDVFSKMVESPEDFLGLLSYALYKRHKIEWLASAERAITQPSLLDSTTTGLRLSSG